MTPSNAAGVPWPVIVAVGGGILGVVGVALMFLVRMLLKAYQKSAEQELSAVRVEAEKELKEFRAITTQKLEAAANEMVKLDRQVRDYFQSNEKMRDMWDSFLREYLKIDSTRGQKVDALFRIVDQMQETLREIRPAINTKVEEMLTHAITELKLYVRDLIEEARDG